MQPHMQKGLGTHKTDGRSARAQGDRTLSRGEPARPLLRVLPITRWIPQDIHSVGDYASGLAAASGHFLAEQSWRGRDDTACVASFALGASVIGISALTDYRLSVAKLIPIRTHETLDYVWGASAIALPFVLGYWKRSTGTALAHVAAGAVTILSSLFTDYRSYKQARARERDRSQGGTMAT